MLISSSNISTNESSSSENIGNYMLLVNKQQDPTRVKMLIRRCQFPWNIKHFLVILCIIILFQSFITAGYLGAVITSLERQYGFSTVEIGLILSCYDFTCIFAIPIWSYYGSKSHRPRLIAFGSLIFAVGCVVFTLPYFTGKRYGYKATNSTNVFSEFNNYSRTFHNFSAFFTAPSDEKKPFSILIFAVVLMAIGASPNISLGITFLCDHLPEKLHSVYTGFVYGSFTAGPALGFLFAFLFLSIWVNAGEKVTPSFHWIWLGRWWAGFFVSAPFLFVSSFLMLTFPSRLKQFKPVTSETNDSSANLGTTNEDSVSANGSIASSKSISIRNFFKSLVALLMNVTFMLISLILSCESILAVIFTSYMVKYLENAYRISSSTSSVLTGSLLIPAAITGIVFSSWVIKKFNLQIKGCIKFILAADLMATACVVLMTLLRCDNASVVFLESMRKNNMSTTSNFCNTTSKNYQPICVERNITFASACDAGCTYKNESGYFGCTNAEEFYRVMLNASNFRPYEVERIVGNLSILSGACPRNCKLKCTLFAVDLFLIAFFTLCGVLPATMIILKSVEHDLRTIALGFEKCLERCLANIPAPIAFGALFDMTCELWSKDGSCLRYNDSQLANAFFITPLVIKTISIALLSLLWVYRTKKGICVEGRVIA